MALLEPMNELGIKPEHECFDIGHIANLDPLIDMGLLAEPLQISCVMGVTGGIRPTARNLAHMAEQIPGGPDGPNNWGVIGDLARPVDARRRRADPRRQHPRRPGGQLLPARRRDGALQRRPRRQGAPADRGRRAPGRHGRRGARRCSACPQARGRRGAAHDRPAAGGRARARPLAAAARARSARCCWPTSAPTCSRSRTPGMGDYVRWSPPFYEGADDSAQVGAVPLAQPQQALDPPQPQGRRAGARCCCAWRATPTCCSSPSARACSTASASATSGCARRTRASSTARSPATARTARTATARATT